MRCTACLLLLLAAAAAAAAQQAQQTEWWKPAVIYQIYPKSFKDSDGDGVGDLNGIIEKLDYLKNLGVSAIWLSPIFKSPMADNGYDIADFEDIDPMFGTLEDFDKLLTEAHNKGIKVILDFVPNHTSDEHEWFIASSDPTHENYTTYKDYYVWKDAKEDGSAPNNWVNMFDGGSAWEWNEDRKQYYLHQFHIKQPDLDYRNPKVLKAMKDEMRFWLEKKVDGFRMDAVMCLVEADGFPDLVEGQPTPMQHQPETYTVIQEFRKVMDEYADTVMMTEAYGTVEEVLGYYGNASNPGAHFSFNFLLITDLNSTSTAGEFVDVIGNWISNITENELWSNWVIGNHDQHRVASRYSPELVDGMNMLVTLLPGTAVTYNGEEIGMEDNYDMTCEVAHDPQGCHDNVTLGNSRDPCRTPFQWDNTTSAGFSASGTTWLPVHENYESLNLEAQKAAERSHFKVYQRLASARQLRVAQRGATSTFAQGSVFAFTRTLGGVDSLLVAVNLGAESQAVDLATMLPQAHHFTVITTSISSPLAEGSSVSALTLGPHESAVLQASGERGTASGLRAPVLALLVSVLLAVLTATGRC